MIQQLYIIIILLKLQFLPHRAILEIKNGLALAANPLILMVGDAGFEPATPAV
jgi:hypothetical protein